TGVFIATSLPVRSFFSSPSKQTTRVQLRRRSRFSVMPYHGRHRSAPCVVAAFAGSAHERQSAADYDYNHNKDGQYWAVHRNLPCCGPEPSVTRTRLSRPYLQTGIRSFRRTTRFGRTDPPDAQTTPIRWYPRRTAHIFGLALCVSATVIVRALDTALRPND